MLMTAATLISLNGSAIDAVVVYSGTRQPANGSFCNIASLEVYRGKEQAIEINHSGFSLGNRGTIEASVNKVIHKYMEYVLFF